MIILYDSVHLLQASLMASLVTVRRADWICDCSQKKLLDSKATTTNSECIHTACLRSTIRATQHFQTKLNQPSSSVIDR
jgi:hypothetical protein